MTSAHARIDCTRCELRSITARVPCISIADGLPAARLAVRLEAVAKGWIVDGARDQGGNEGGLCPTCRAVLMEERAIVVDEWGAGVGA